MSTVDLPQTNVENAERQTWTPERSVGPMVDMTNPDTRNNFSLSDEQGQEPVSSKGQMIFSNPYSEQMGSGFQAQSQMDHDFGISGRNGEQHTGDSGGNWDQDRGRQWGGDGSDNSTTTGQGGTVAVEQQILTDLQQIDQDLQQIITDVSQLFGVQPGGTAPDNPDRTPTDGGGGGGGGSQPPSGSDNTPTGTATSAVNDNGGQTGQSGQTGPTDSTGPSAGSGSGTEATGNGNGSGSGAGTETTGNGNDSGSGAGTETTGNVNGNSSGAGTETTGYVSGSGTGTGGTDTTGSGSGPTDTGTPATTISGFDPTPSWADDTSINNNNGALVSPSYFAQTIPDNATYAAANLSNLQFANTGYQYDEGEMIDERGMSPSQLETIPVYNADQGWDDNNSTGQQLGTIEVPIGTSVPRPITTYSNGAQGANNSITTFIQPDGEEMSFAKTYIGTNSQVGDGGTVLIGAPVGQTGWFGNEVALTNSDVTDAINDGTAPSHALGFVVPTDVLSNVDDGVAGPSKYADSGYESEYTSSNTNLRMGSLLAIPKDVTAQELGLQTSLGKALLATMEEYGGYVADTTPTDNTFSIETTLGVQNQIQQSGESSEFTDDLNKIMAAAQVVTSNPNASPDA